MVDGILGKKAKEWWWKRRSVITWAEAQSLPEHANGEVL